MYLRALRQFISFKFAGQFTLLAHLQHQERHLHFDLCCGVMYRCYFFLSLNALRTRSELPGLPKSSTHCNLSMAPLSKCTYIGINGNPASKEAQQAVKDALQAVKDALE